MTLDVTRHRSVFFRHFAESVTYTPLVGEARTVTALVERLGQEVLEAGHGPRWRVTAPASGDDGIDPAALDTGGDTLTLSRRPGETAAARQVLGILSMNETTITLEVG